MRELLGSARDDSGVLAAMIPLAVGTLRWLRHEVRQALDRA